MLELSVFLFRASSENSSYQISAFGNNDFIPVYSLLSILSLVGYFFKLDWSNTFKNFQKFPKNTIIFFIGLNLLFVLIFNISSWWLLIVFVLLVFWSLCVNLDPDQRYFWIFTSPSGAWEALKMNFSIAQLETIIYLYYDVMEFVIHLFSIVALKIFFFFLMMLLNKVLVKYVITNVACASIFLFILFVCALIGSNHPYLYSWAKPEYKNKLFLFTPRIIYRLIAWRRQEINNLEDWWEDKTPAFWVLQNVLDVTFIGICIYKSFALMIEYYQKRIIFANNNRYSDDLWPLIVPDVLIL